jgi:hypothetical protein
MLHSHRRWSRAGSPGPTRSGWVRHWCGSKPPPGATPGPEAATPIGHPSTCSGEPNRPPRDQPAPADIRVTGRASDGTHHGIERTSPSSSRLPTVRRPAVGPLPPDHPDHSERPSARSEGGDTRPAPAEMGTWPAPVIRRVPFARPWSPKGIGPLVGPHTAPGQASRAWCNPRPGTFIPLPFPGPDPGPARRRRAARTEDRRSTPP